jgi:phosphomannomutase
MMKIEDWKKLQNGSDIRGVAMEGIEGENVNLTGEVAGKLGASFAAWLDKNGKGLKKVAVGTDSRITGPSLNKAFINDGMWWTADSPPPLPCL